MAEEAEKILTSTTTVEEENGRKIVIAVDEGDESIFALKWAVENLMVSHTPDQVYLLHVQPTLNLYPAPGFYVTPEMMESLRKSQEKNSMDILQRAKSLCEEKQVHVKTVNLIGDARDIICQAVEKMGAEMLVMGSHGYGALKRAFLGSVSDYCVHHAKCPVLIVKKPSK
uniref:UspA domain-containing protein n=1 Tax=Araucaria cunninghamii TaxID=56994 RepID=A0A0D6QSJ0_ARACU